MSNGTFDINLFLKESKETLLNPGSHFSTLNLSGGMAEPLIKAVIYGTAAALVYLIFDLLNIRGSGALIFGGVYGFSGFLKLIIGTVVGLFLCGGILLLISSVCKGNIDYEANIRVTSDYMVLMPVFAIFSIFTSIGFYIGLVVTLILSAYSLWLFYHGLVEALKCRADAAKIVCYVFVGLIVLFMLIGMSASNKNNRLIRELKKDARELQKDLKK